MKYLAVFVFLSASLHGAEEAKIRSAAERSLRLLESVQGQWKQQCFSCHHQTIPVMAVAASRKAGLPVNEATAAKVAEHSFGLLNAADVAIEDAVRIDPAFAIGLTLVSASTAGVEPSLPLAIHAERLASIQRPDGHWPTFDARPPSAYSLAAATAVSARAVDLYSHPSRRAEVAARLEKAKDWLASAEPHSVEDAAWQLVGLGWLGGSEAGKARISQTLLDWQNEDGGWGQLAGEASDAYATARALQALGRQRGGKAWERGMDWLLAAQLPDGSWHVKTRIATPARVSPPYFESGFPHGKDQYISCAATAWALMAMGEGLPHTGKAPAPAPAARPRGVEPWMETAYFGSVRELKSLLEAGLNPNTATPEGDTVLMFAAHDEEKVRLLLEKGAKAAARSKSGFDALMVSTLQAGTAPAVQALLASGAEVNPKARVRFKANALSLAAITGDEAVIRQLLDAGANPKAVMAYLGVAMMRPFDVVVQFGYEDAVRLMVKRGWKVDFQDDQGMTALTWAAMMHRPETVKLLLEFGADPLHKDNYGLTPAEQAAAIRYAPEGVVATLKAATQRATR